ncbi:unnamed protein product, partial [marine sediment metagenome]
NRTRTELRKAEVDFAPVSEFGIGFLSCFLLGDRVEVETAMRDPQRKQDTLRRKLIIDGPTRLIRLEEQENAGPTRFKGTRITIYVSRGAGKNKLTPPTWHQVHQYLVGVCQDLPYDLELQHVTADGESRDTLEPLPLSVPLPPHLEKAAIRIPVDDEESGLKGEIALVSTMARSEAERTLFQERGLLSGPPAAVSTEKSDALLRGGFRIGDVPALPYDAAARLGLVWESRADKRYLMPSLSRDAIADSPRVADD